MDQKTNKGLLIKRCERKGKFVTCFYMSLIQMLIEVQLLAQTFCRA